MSGGISGANIVIKFANTRNRGRICLLSQSEKTIIDLRNVEFEFCQVVHHYCLL